MIRKIKNTDDVVIFAKQLVKESVSFHCDDDFNDYVNVETKKKTYAKRQANFRNNLMNQCFEICEKNGIDIYDVRSGVLMQETGLNKIQQSV